MYANEFINIVRSNFPNVEIRFEGKDNHIDKAYLIVDGEEQTLLNSGDTAEWRRINPDYNPNKKNCWNTPLECMWEHMYVKDEQITSQFKLHVRKVYEAAREIKEIFSWDSHNKEDFEQVIEILKTIGIHNEDGINQVFKLFDNHDIEWNSYKDKEPEFLALYAVRFTGGRLKFYENTATEDNEDWENMKEVDWYYSSLPSTRDLMDVIRRNIEITQSS